MRIKEEKRGFIGRLAAIVFSILMSFILISGAASSLTTINASAASVISKGKAKKIVLKSFNVKASKIEEYECEYNDDDDPAVYEIGFSTEKYDYTAVVNAQTGTINERGCEIIEEPEYPSGKSIISKKAAKKKALANAGLKKAKKVKVSLEDYEEEDDDADDIEVDDVYDYGYYKVTFSNAGYKYEYELDAVSGAVNKLYVKKNKK